MDAMEMTDERRRARRYRLPGTIAVADVQAQMIDLSSNGVSFETTRPFTQGEEVAIVLPLYGGNPDLRVTCDARIVRVEQRGATFMVSATYDFLPPHLTPRSFGA
jgi:hypothetical protein